jgi:membrane dipeptidase
MKDKGKIAQFGVILDAHSDILNDVVERRRNGCRKVVAKRHIPRLEKGGVNALVCAIYVEARYKPHQPLTRALHLLDAMHSELEETPEQLKLCCRLDDFYSAARSGKLAVLLGLEGGEPLGEDFSILRLFYRLGIRLVGLTWNQRNQIADGIGEDQTRSRLTKYGIQLVKELNNLGVIIDLAHIGESAFYDVLEISEQPVVVSHANCTRICNHARNLTDGQLEALASQGGVLGITFYPPLVSATRPNLDKVLEHIEHAVRVMGIDHVGIGADFSDFISWDTAEVGEGFEEHPKTEGLESVDGMPELVNRLLANGYSQEEAAKILSGNFLRVFGQIIG